MNIKNGYYLGLDMGTNSVGWAVTDKEYRVLRAKGKDLWGIREFDEAETSVNRRTQRISRRRRQRETARIGLLKEYFNDAIKSVDPNFYQRLDNSKYYLEDKDENVRDKNGIFNDPDFTDKDYFKKYPTIFHLRKALIEDDNEAHDVRLVYLAILNMFKHRGHFLDKSGQLENSEGSIADLYKELSDFVEECNIQDNASCNVVLPKLEDEKTFASAITNRDISRKERYNELLNILHINKSQKQLLEIVKGICGLKMNLVTIFGDEIKGEEDSKIDLSFSDNNAEETLAELADKLADDEMNVILGAKKLYSEAVLHAILKGDKYLSYARVRDYEKHKSDLRKLKDLLKRTSMEDYNRMFRSEEAGSYSAYVNSCNSSTVKGNIPGGPRRRGLEGRKPEDFYAFTKKIIKNYPDSEEKKYILSEIEREQFLPKQLTASNGVIPNQVHAKELKVILGNAESYLQFLKEKDDSGLTISERIIKLFSFTIPYYIGPVSKDISRGIGTGWAVRKDSGRVLPWNLSDKIDIGETRKGFIERLIRRCTYLNDEKVLPKASLLYESFCVLNEINNIKVAGTKISVETKQALYRELYQKGKKVSRKDIEKYLICCGIIKEGEQDLISGIDIQINNCLASFGKMTAVFGENIHEDKYQKISEDIIKLCTIYGDEKTELKKILSDKYCSEINSEFNVLDEKKVKRITGFKFKDWGRVSYEFLTLHGADKSTGELRSIIRTMWETNDNLMELLSDRYTFNEEIELRTNSAVKSLSEFSIEDLDGMYFSAPVKRMVWQTLRIIKELEHVMGEAPEKIFVEMAKRPDEIKKRTDTRAKSFTELYKNIKDEDKDWIKFIEKADKDGSIRSKKIYLYLTQMGRCMYTRKEIELSEVMTDKYDIDHIYPRHFVKDDNIANNLVLVEKTKNAHKSDTYPIEESIRKNMHDFWKSLLDRKLITKEKYLRLTSASPFTEEQLAGFIARQLVETRQGTKGVADILREVMPEKTSIIFSKASNVSDFRHENNLFKSRIANDLHHAHDAYLNIVVGNVYNTKFTNDPRRFVKDYESDKLTNNYHLSKMFNYDVIRNGYCAWRAGENGTISTVKNMLAKPSPMLTRMSFEGHGQIANQTLYGKAKAIKSPDAYIPLKESDAILCDVKKYGGFSSASTAYFVLAEYTKKKKIVRSIEAIPIYIKGKADKDKTIIEGYIRKRTGGENIRVADIKIKMQSLIKLNGYYLYLTGITGKQLILRNAVQLIFDQDIINYIKKLEKEYDTELNSEDNIKLYDTLIDKHKTNIMMKRPNPVLDKLSEGREKFIKLNLDNQKKVLKEILKLSSLGGSGADLSLIGASANTGVMLTNKNISANKEFKLIERSVTGIYDKEIDLLKI